MQVESQEARCKSVTLRKENHGDEKVAAVSVAIEGLVLPAALIDELCPMGGQKLSDVLFIDENPRLQQVYPLSVDLDLEPYIVTINRLQMTDCTIRNIKLTPDVGRVVNVSLQINAQMQDNYAAPLSRIPQEDIRLSVEPAQVDIDDKNEEQAKAA